MSLCVRQESDQPALLSPCLPQDEATFTETRTAPRIPIASLTSRVSAFGAAGLRRSLQGSFT